MLFLSTFKAGTFATIFAVTLNGTVSCLFLIARFTSCVIESGREGEQERSRGMNFILIALAA